MLVQVLLFDGFDPLDALAPHEVLGAAGEATGGAVQVQLAGAGPVVSGTGLTIHPQAELDVQRAEVLIVPGAAGSMAEGATEIRDRLTAALTPRLHQDLHAFAARPGTVLAAVCGGSLLLGMAGLLNGRPAVTHRAGLAQLTALGARVVPARVVDDGDLVTAGGVTSGLDLALHLAERFFGAEVALGLEQLFEHERRGVVWRAGVAA